MTTTSANGQYHRVVLSNGLRILVAPMPHTRSATVGLFFGTGSRYESYEQAGIAHFFEHMLFKGSAQYPSAQVIAETIEGVWRHPQRRDRQGTDRLLGQGGERAPTQVVRSPDGHGACAAL